MYMVLSKQCQDIVKDIISSSLTTSVDLVMCIWWNIKMKHLKGLNCFKVKLRINSIRKSKSFVQIVVVSTWSKSSKIILGVVGLSHNLLHPEHHILMVSEKRNWTLLNTVWSVMSRSNLPLSFWNYVTIPNFRPSLV